MGKNSSARTPGAPAPRTPSTPSVLPTAKGSVEKTRDAHQTARKTLSTSGVQSTANNSKARTRGVATATPLILRARAQSSSVSQLFRIPPLESREDQKRSRTKEQWLNRGQVCP